MIYLYYDRITKRLYLFTHASSIESKAHDIYWDNIESVVSDKERGQITAHKFGDGIIGEFPLERTVLIHQQPLK